MSAGGCKTHSSLDVPAQINLESLEIAGKQVAGVLIRGLRDLDQKTCVAGSGGNLPNEFELFQNYPNPFNLSTVIRFASKAPTDVSLIVYNLSGQKMATLVEGMREAGMYRVNWDGTDDDGNALASGIYLYRLKSSTYEETKKLLLLR